MFRIVCALAGMLFVLLTAEILWHRKKISGEYARKYVHVLGGSFVAFWPYFLPMPDIRVIAAASMALWMVARFLHVSYAMHDIKRRSVGELLYPFSVFLLTTIAQANWIFTVSVLFLSLADGMAAVFGKRFGTKKMTYKVPAGKKTLQGSAAYVVSCYVALAIGALLGGREAIAQSWIITIGWLPLMCVFVENISPFGTDNFTVPMLVVTVLNLALTVSVI